MKLTAEDWRAFEQLKAIRAIALMNYPYADDDPTAPNLLLALGEIAGMAGRWIKEIEHEHGLPMLKEGDGK